MKCSRNCASNLLQVGTPKTSASYANTDGLRHGMNRVKCAHVVEYGARKIQRIDSSRVTESKTLTRGTND